ncbi:ABC transporter [Candidatus Epulonipiscium fishelsonii]|nr:ABC transporter [Epulopiscium sp. SCG-B05WGA-EpuloA1]
MISIKNVTKCYGLFKAVDDISIEVEKGTIHGIIGQNGAGKTTLIKSVAGIYKVDEGSIKIDSEEVYENPKIKARIGYVQDQNAYFEWYKIKTLVDFYQEVYPTFSKEKFNKYNEQGKLDLNKKVKNLSKGMKMRLSIMLNLAINPDVLILDEPTSGLDVIAKKQILDWIISDVAERQLTVLISSHHLSELEKICDTITVMSEGKTAFEDTVYDLKNNICKMQVAFKEVPDFDKLPSFVHTEKIGSVYYIVGKSKEYIETALKDYDLILMDQIPLTLEEVFIYISKEAEAK